MSFKNPRNTRGKSLACEMALAAGHTVASPVDGAVQYRRRVGKFDVITTHEKIFGREIEMVWYDEEPEIGVAK